MTEDEPVSELDIHLPGVTFDGDNEYLDIEGDAKALGELADAFERASSISVGDSKQPGHIVIRRNDSKLSIGYDGSALTLAGDDAGLNKFAEVLRLVAGGPQKPSGFSTTRTSTRIRAISGSLLRRTLRSSSGCGRYSPDRPSLAWRRCCSVHTLRTAPARSSVACIRLFTAALV
jgi:hypothetical protein